MNLTVYVSCGVLDLHTQPKCVAYGTNGIFNLHMWYDHAAQIKKAP